MRAQRVGPLERGADVGRGRIRRRSVATRTTTSCGVAGSSSGTRLDFFAAHGRPSIVTASNASAQPGEQARVAAGWPTHDRDLDVERCPRRSSISSAIASRSSRDTDRTGTAQRGQATSAKRA